MLPDPPRDESCVLCSAGLDSVVLVAWAAQRAPVQPVYVRAGLAWEDDELARLEEVLALPDVRPPVILEFDVRDLYPASHWALRGTPPAYDTADEDVYLPGRNVLLLSKAAVLAASRKIGHLMLGPLAGNPFPDATPEFLRTMGAALSLGLAHRIDIQAPFATVHKADVIRLGAALGVRMERTLSCMNPQKGMHCGLCSKCRERRDGFAEAGVPDLTAYAAPSPR
jgi:7-cyano-7-deazaguanine synthase